MPDWLFITCSCIEQKNTNLFKGHWPPKILLFGFHTPLEGLNVYLVWALALSLIPTWGQTGQVHVEKLFGLSVHPLTSLLLVKEDESYSNDHEKLKTFDLQLHALILIHSKMHLVSVLKMVTLQEKFIFPPQPKVGNLVSSGVDVSKDLEYVADIAW